ncbi:MAG: DUF3419 family protein [Planctomycetota bacterium]
MSNGNEFADSVALDTLRYSMVWEDHAMVEQALQPGPDDHVLIIASSGDNAFNLLARDPRDHAPRRVTAVDASPAQIAVCELKLAAIRHSDQLLLDLVIGGDEETPDIVRNVLWPQLTPASRAWWDAHGDDILPRGLLAGGRLERWFAGFAQPLLAERPDAVQRLLFAPTLDEQRAVFAAEFDAPAFAQRFREYFGQQAMASHGRDPAQMRYVETPDVGAHFWQRFAHTCRTLHLATDFYMHVFLMSSYRTTLPPYLRNDRYEALRDRADRISLRTATLEQVLDEAATTGEPFDHACLSDVFEYMSPDATAALFDRLARAIRPGGRICYWNLMVPRAADHPRLRAHRELADRLHQQDRAWFYRAFHIEEVLPA